MQLSLVPLTPAVQMTLVARDHICHLLQPKALQSESLTVYFFFLLFKSSFASYPSFLLLFSSDKQFIVLFSVICTLLIFILLFEFLFYNFVILLYLLLVSLLSFSISILSAVIFFIMSLCLLFLTFALSFFYNISSLPSDINFLSLICFIYYCSCFYGSTFSFTSLLVHYLFRYSRKRVIGSEIKASFNDQRRDCWNNFEC